MDPFVGVAVALLRERLETMAALKRFLARVDSLVELYMTLPRKRLPTESAVEGLFSRVCPPARSNVGVCDKAARGALLSDLVRRRLLALVDPALRRVAPPTGPKDRCLDGTLTTSPGVGACVEPSFRNHQRGEQAAAIIVVEALASCSRQHLRHCRASRPCDSPREPTRVVPGQTPSGSDGNQSASSWRVCALYWSPAMPRCWSEGGGGPGLGEARALSLGPGPTNHEARASRRCHDRAR